ncbi:hypothetical protein ACU8KH_00210 [Lachancea thermotolerans]
MWRLAIQQYTHRDYVVVAEISGPTRIRTGVVRIRTESDNHYTIEPFNWLEVTGQVYNIYIAEDHLTFTHLSHQNSLFFKHGKLLGSITPVRPCSLLGPVIIVEVGAKLEMQFVLVLRLHIRTLHLANNE